MDPYPGSSTEKSTPATMPWTGGVSQEKITGEKMSPSYGRGMILHL